MTVFHHRSKPLTSRLCILRTVALSFLLALPSHPFLFADPPSSPSPSSPPAASASASPSPSVLSTPPSTSNPSLRERIDKLDKQQIEKAISTIRGNYLRSSSLNDDELQRATLEGLVHRLSPGIQLGLPKQQEEANPPFPFLAEILDGRAGYIRLGELNAQNLAQTDAILGKFSAEGIKSLILDLRGIPAGTNYELAAEYARRFCPKGKVLFTLQKPNAKQERIFTSNQEPVFSGLIVVLTDSETSGASEVLTETLRSDAQAMIVGEKTMGGAVEFEEVPLGGGQEIRVAVAEIVFPENRHIFPQGVAPDITIGLPKEMRDQIFHESHKKGVSQFVFEVERPHMNEAALVTQTNPEIESTANSSRDSPPLYDTPLQRALDLITALAIHNNRKTK